MERFIEALKACPVIAAARDEREAELAALSHAGVVFLLGGTIMTLPQMVETAKSSGKPVFVHLDLVSGLGHDAAAAFWCAQVAKPDGLISTRAAILRKAREQGLITIQRLFAMDSSAIGSGAKQAQLNKPDMVEILPGLVPKAVRMLREQLPELPIIAGGLVTQIDEIRAMLGAGALGVSTGERALWALSKAELL